MFFTLIKTFKWNKFCTVEFFIIKWHISLLNCYLHVNLFINLFNLFVIQNSKVSWGKEKSYFVILIFVWKSWIIQDLTFIKSQLLCNCAGFLFGFESWDHNIHEVVNLGCFPEFCFYVDTWGRKMLLETEFRSLKLVFVVCLQRGTCFPEGCLTASRWKKRTTQVFSGLFPGSHVLTSVITVQQKGQNSGRSS